jgi:transposase
LGQLQQHTPDSVLELLKLSRGNVDVLSRLERRLVRGLLHQAELQERVRRLTSIAGVGEITALSWALEVGEAERFRSVRQAVSYCGLCSAQNSSAGKEYRGPISKQRNHHLQAVLVEAAKLAPRWNPLLAQVHARALDGGDHNQATLAVARKLVAYLLAVDRSGQPFQVRTAAASTAPAA